MRDILSVFSKRSPESLIKELSDYKKIHLLAYYEAGKLEHLISLVDESFNAEIPVERKIFDMKVLSDVDAINKFKSYLIKSKKIKNVK